MSTKYCIFHNKLIIEITIHILNIHLHVRVYLLYYVCSETSNHSSFTLSTDVIYSILHGKITNIQVHVHLLVCVVNWKSNQIVNV